MQQQAHNQSSAKNLPKQSSQLHQPQYYCSSWGLAGKGQLGYASAQMKSINALRVNPIEAKENFLDMGCGENHSLLLTNQMELVSCGSNTYGQLGIGQAQDKLAQQSLFRVICQQQAQCQFDQVACGSEHSMALTTDGELYSWGLNFKGQLGVGDFENRLQPVLVDSFQSGQMGANGAQQQSQSQTKKYLVQMLKRSKSKEAGGVAGAAGVNGSQTQRIQPNAILAEKGSGETQLSGQGQSRQFLAATISSNSGINSSQGQRNNPNGQGNGASKSIFNASYDKLKPSKSVDLTSSLIDGGIPSGSIGGTMNSLMLADDQDSIELFLFKSSEKVEQVACGSIHTLIRTNMHRIFSCGNGSTFALGHQTKESCSTFRQIEFFNCPPGVSQQSSSGENNGQTGIQNAVIKTIACGLSHSGCVTGDGSVYTWGLTGEVQGKANQEQLFEKCLFKRPTQASFRNCLERDTSSSAGMQQHRRKSTVGEENAHGGQAVIEDIRMGEYFTIALSQRGYVYSWGMNDKGQLGIGQDIPHSFEPVAVSSSKGTLSKAVQRIDCGLKHVLALTKDYQLYSWGSNQLNQLGRSTQQKPGTTNQPGLVTAFEQAKPFKIVCGSYHNICLSYRMPKLEENENTDEEAKQLNGQKAGQLALQQKADAQQQMQKDAGAKVAHQDEGCPHLETIAQLKGQIKRLRQELIMKGPSKRRGHDYDSEEESEYGASLDEEEKAALRMLNPEQRKMFCELESAGANPQYLKKKLKQALLQQQQHINQAFASNAARAFIQNNEIPFSELSYDKKLSEGGYGIVYRGRWKHTVVAIKEIKREIIEQDKLEEFKNECAVMEVIRHPNIVLFLGACTVQPNLCIILEYCARGSLWSLLHDLSIKMTWDYRKKFALDIAKGVYYLHTSKQPILHRDLKSLNILLDHALTAKLADFGWTRIKAKQMTSKIGTYQWMAPEVIKGFKYTEKADVFSFGVIMWELATRKPPYYGIDGQVVSQRVVKEGLRPKISEREAPGPFLDLMRRCWDDDPDRRPYFGEIMRELEQMNFKNIG